MEPQQSKIHSLGKELRSIKQFFNQEKQLEAIYNGQFILLPIRRELSLFCTYKFDLSWANLLSSNHWSIKLIFQSFSSRIWYQLWFKLIQSKDQNYILSIMEQEQVDSLEQAKLIISIKNDKINSLNNKMKMIQKKSNIKVAQINYQLQHQKSKVCDLHKQIQKMKQTYQLETNKLKQLIKHYQQKNQKIKQQQNWQLNNQREINDEKQRNIKYIASYLQLQQMIKIKQQEIKQYENKMDQIKKDTLSVIEQSFCKLAKYENIMIQLHEKNSQLENHAKWKQELYAKRNNQLQQKNQFLNEKINELSSQIEYLRSSLQKYQWQSINYKDIKAQYQNSMQIIFELTSQFQFKEDKYLKNIQIMQERLKIADDTQKQLKQQLIREITRINQTVWNLEQSIIVERNNAQIKQQIVQIMNINIKSMKCEINKQKDKIQRLQFEVKQLVKINREIKQQIQHKQNFYNNSIKSLNQQLDFLRSVQNNYEIREDFDIGQSIEDQKWQKNIIMLSKSLMSQLDDNQMGKKAQLNYQDLYEHALKRHNLFIKQVFYILQNISTCKAK